MKHYFRASSMEKRLENPGLNKAKIKKSTVKKKFFKLS
jgi:hypothetical protein